VVIIGAGIGGLSAGALLAKRGLEVTVLEAHDRPGGYCSSWTRTVRHQGRSMRYCFDAGVQDISGIGERGPLRRLLRQLAAEDRIDWRPVGHLYAKFGLRLSVAADAKAYVEQLSQLFPADARGIEAFFRQIEAVYREMYADIEATGGVPAVPANLEAMMAWPDRHPHAWRWMRQPFRAMLDEYLSDPQLKSILTTLADYITEEPALLSVADMAPLFGYYFDGGYFPAGGSQSLADLLSAIITEGGGQVHLRRRAIRILVEDGRVAGVETAEGVVHRAPMVIAAGDVQAMLMDLLNAGCLPQGYLRKLGAMRRGPSAVMVSLGVDEMPDLPARIFIRHGEMEFGIGNPSAVDPSLAPPGHAALTVLSLLSEGDAATWVRSAKDYRERKAMVADRLIAAIEATVWPDLRRHIRYQQVGTPPTFARYAGTRAGNIYGAARGQWCPPVQSPIPGLLLAGAGTATGAGIEAVVVSGTIAADIVAPPPGHGYC
jgi:phytoene dehydrogenase-like protein